MHLNCPWDKNFPENSVNHLKLTLRFVPIKRNYKNDVLNFRLPTQKKQLQQYSPQIINGNAIEPKNMRKNLRGRVDVDVIPTNLAINIIHFAIKYNTVF